MCEYISSMFSWKNVLACRAWVHHHWSLRQHTDPQVNLLRIHVFTMALIASLHGHANPRFPQVAVFMIKCLLPIYFNCLCPRFVLLCDSMRWVLPPKTFLHTPLLCKWQNSDRNIGRGKNPCQPLYLWALELEGRRQQIVFHREELQGQSSSAHVFVTANS